MHSKKNVRCICIVIAAFFAFIILLTYMSNKSFRWSRNVCDAIRLGDTDKALLLIDKGICKGYNLNTLSEHPSFLWTLLESTPQTPLQAACKKGNYAVAEKLLENGAEPVSADGGIDTEPLLCVLERSYLPNDKEIVQLLIDYGADLSCDNGSRNNLLTNAAFRAPRDFDAEKDAKTGTHPYDETVARGITEVFLLLADGNDGDTANEAGRTPLHCAAMMENWYLVRVLVAEFSYSLDAKDMNGNTAYDLAVENKAPHDILNILKCQ